MNKRMANLVLGLDIFYFLKKKQILWFYQNVLWNWYQSTCSHFDWQHICYVWWTCFSTDTTHIGTICAHLLANVFLYSHEAGFIQGFHKKNEQKLARSFNSTCLCLDDVLSLFILALRFSWSHTSVPLSLKYQIRVISKLPNSEQSYKGKVKTHYYIIRQNQSTTENSENRNDPH